jgi:hypothetical protein
VYEARPRDGRSRNLKEFDGTVDSCRFEAGLDQSDGQGTGAAAHIRDPADWDRGIVEQSQNFARRALRKPSEGRRLDVCEILRVDHGYFE